MMRFLIILGIAIIVLGLLGPYLSRLGLGRLPGDVVIEREGGSFYFPFMTCLILSLVLSAALWLLGDEPPSGVRPAARATNEATRRWLTYWFQHGLLN